MSGSNIEALSALGVAQQVSADNIANMNTDGFRASAVEFETGPDGMGVRVGDIRESTASAPYVDGVEGSNTDVATEMVGMIGTGNAFSANAVAVRAAEETTGHLLDMIA